LLLYSSYLPLGVSQLVGHLLHHHRAIYSNHQCIDKLEFYEHCVYGKQRRVRFGTTTHNTKDILECIHSDLWGESRVPSLGGARYMLTIIDDYSRRVWSFFIKNKSDVFNTFKEWKIMIENQSGKRIKKLCTDDGLEFCSG
jgi:5'-3' exoribonuclease 2